MLDTAQARFEWFDATTRFWPHAARRQPVFLIFDDLHCADPTSVRLLAFFANLPSICKRRRIARLGRNVQASLKKINERSAQV